MPRTPWVLAGAALAVAVAVTATILGLAAPRTDNPSGPIVAGSTNGSSQLALAAPSSGPPSPTPAAASPSSSAAVGTIPPATAASSSTDQGKPSPPGWGDPILVENFDGPTLDPSRWGIYDSPDSQKSPRSPDRSTVSGGQLKLTGGPDANGRDVSGGVSSRLDLRYGRWEARFRADPGRGYNAVMLLWPETGTWPDDGEIDLIEVSDTNRQGGAVFVHNGSQDNREGKGVDLDFSTWHTIAVEWLPNRISWIFDGVTKFALQRPSSGFNPIPSTSPMHLAVQLDVGCWGTLPCRDDSTPSRVSMYVDNVRIWKAPPSMLG